MFFKAQFRISKHETVLLRSSLNYFVFIKNQHRMVLHFYLVFIKNQHRMVFHFYLVFVKNQYTMACFFIWFSLKSTQDGLASLFGFHWNQHRMVSLFYLVFIEINTGWFCFFILGEKMTSWAYLEGSGLKPISQWCVHLLIFTTSLFKLFVEAWTFGTTEKMKVSTVKSLHLDEILLNKSFI